ncbi:MAG: globin domain-containing protein [Pseudomonadota bacterium]|nr:globin domain-containing protein [Pseudomonadota bacterium]
MLSQPDRKLLKAFSAQLHPQSEAVAAKTCACLFQHNPELKRLFAATTDNPQQKFVEFMTRYSEQIEDLTKLTPLLDQIALKHVAAAVQPEYYSTVGHCFLEALQSIFGDAFDEKLFLAWQKAYAALSQELITREKALRGQI